MNLFSRIPYLVGEIDPLPPFLQDQLDLLAERICEDDQVEAVTGDEGEGEGGFDGHHQFLEARFGAARHQGYIERRDLEFA